MQDCDRCGFNVWHQGGCVICRKDERIAEFEAMRDRAIEASNDGSASDAIQDMLAILAGDDGKDET